MRENIAENMRENIAGDMITELMKSQNKEMKVNDLCKKIADTVVVKKPGDDPRLIKGEDIDKELVTMGLFLELSDIEETGLIAVYDSRKSFELSDHKYVFGPVMVCHKGKENTECLSEDEICEAVIKLMDAEVSLTYDETDFKAYKIW